MLRSRTPSRSLAATLALLAAACGGGDTNAPNAPNAPGATAGPVGAGPSNIISDATRNSGDPRFYWLAPIVKGSTPAATFDPNAQPQVSVCVIGTVAANAPCVGEPIATFSRTTGTGSEIVRVDAAAEQYIVNFHTDRFDLDPAKTYRITVQLDGRRLGFADLELADKPGELKNVNTAEYVPLLDGRTLPVKFSIRQGIVVPPTAVADAYPASGAFNRAEPVTVDAASGLLANDDLGVPAATIDPASIVATENLGGTLTVQPDGSFSLSGATRTGTAAFSYTIRNGDATSSTAAVTVLVGGAPTAVNDAVTVTAGETVSIDLLANDEVGLPEATLDIELPSFIGNGRLSRDGSTLTLTAPTSVRTQSVTYTLTNSVGSSTGSVTFTIVPGPVATTAIFSGAGQTTVVGQILANPVVFAFGDRFGNLVPGVDVTLTASGDGEAAPRLARTNAGGVITIGWRLATTAGLNTLTATTGGVTATAFATGICFPSSIRLLSDGEAMRDPSPTPSGNWTAKVTVRNNCGTPVPGAFITWAPRSAGVFFPGSTGSTTNASGVAEINFLVPSACPFSGTVRASSGGDELDIPVRC